MTSYEAGYEDGKAGLSPSIYYTHDDDYQTGYADGKGELELARLAEGRRYVDDEAVLGNPPPGFEFTGERKTPEPGEYYLTKNGNAKLATKVRGNNQTRHILRRL